MYLSKSWKHGLASTLLWSALSLSRDMTESSSSWSCDELTCVVPSLHKGGCSCLPNTVYKEQEKNVNMAISHKVLVHARLKNARNFGHYLKGIFLNHTVVQNRKRQIMALMKLHYMHKLVWAIQLSRVFDCMPGISTRYILAGWSMKYMYMYQLYSTWIEALLTIQCYKFWNSVKYEKVIRGTV